MNSDTPKYQTIFDTIREEILSGKYDKAIRFPSEWQLTRRFGVSRPTVSRALQELARQGVLKRRKGSGSVINPSFRARARFLGMLVPDYNVSEFFTPICTAFAAECANLGYTLLYGTPTASDSARRIDEVLSLTDKYIHQEVAGVIFEPVELTSDSVSINEEIVSRLEKNGIPFVLIDRDFKAPPERSAYDLVGIDNVAAGERLAKHLIECGARKILFLYRANATPYTTQMRLAGVHRAYREAGLRWSNRCIAVCEPDDGEAIGKIMRGRDCPDAVICSNDFTAAALLKTLNRLRLRVPQHLLLAGFDDLNYAQLTDPALTTIHQPCDEIGRIACQTLIARIAEPNAPPRQILLDAPLVIRESSGQGRTDAFRF